jgi:hydrogenase maturation protein HypF
VGFRPFIVRLAKQHRQHGWIANTTDGVIIAIEGKADKQQQFLDGLNNKLPPFAEIKSQTITSKPLENYQDFQIKASKTDGNPSAFVLPDIATCPECIEDIFDPASRYFNYGFTSCSHCGPRYSIMAEQPYDRANTSMAAFTPCPTCEQEYLSIDNRRFHAQTIACPECGPQLQLLDDSGALLAKKNNALLTASQYLKAGEIIAIKGIGGYQLLVDAANHKAIERLRQRKHRPQKPLALMVPDLITAKKLCVINELELSALKSYAAPIVLLKRRETIDPQLLCDTVAPDTNLLGIMLPYSPLHHLLLRAFGSTVVATSGNRQNEPICFDDDQALTRLNGIADYFLTHNRPILRPLDDSIVRDINGNMTVLRRARGYTPIPITLMTALPNTLAMGGQLKSTLAINHGRQVILSQHLGDLDSEASQQEFHSTLTDLQQFYKISPTKVMHDLHSGYASSQFASHLGKDTQAVQHHYAHALSCMAEHGLEPPVLGIMWDGSGLGADETLWGGEFLLITQQGFERYAHFRPFPLPGGVKAIQEPRRTALGLLYEIFSDSIFERQDLPFSKRELNLLQQALVKQINCPHTTSAGRLFDAIASLLGICQINQYEGQAAMMLENSATTIPSDQHYQFHLSGDMPIVIDWQISIGQIVGDIAQNTAPAVIANKFHNTLAEIILAIAIRAEQKNIALSGGCFQNALLVKKAVSKLKTAGFNVYCHEKVPPNDGGLALGQLYAAKYIR